MRVGSTLFESADSVLIFGLWSDWLRATSRACHADTMVVDELSAGPALVEQRAHCEHRKYR